MQDEQDESAIDASKTLMHSIGMTLAHFTTGEHNDDIAAHSKVFEHRLRQLPRDRLPHFLHELENSLFKYLMDKTLENETSKQFTNLTEERLAFGACGAATWTGTCEVTGLKNPKGEAGKSCRCSTI
ncbi:hypothetical protein F7725_002910 [Dissostichus mawsoni]|uniref:Uncharacterized protein n=1 Tax=Dissostichus mawsoni TaxID=36200 RepID=A0A7J5Y8P2_DISMA|nr:hypothetical protein F7725_002910 [Dissostichus mawsoni]